MRYIDADNFMEELNDAQIEFDEHYKGLGKAKVMLSLQPTADVVEVVRCKDCIYWWSPMEDDFHYCRLKKGLVGLVVKEDYCCYGKRRSDEK